MFSLDMFNTTLNIKFCQGDLDPSNDKCQTVLEGFHYYQCNLCIGKCCYPPCTHMSLLLHNLAAKLQMQAGWLLSLLFARRAEASWCDAGFLFPPPGCKDSLQTPIVECSNDSLAHPRFGSSHLFSQISRQGSFFSAQLEWASQAWATPCWESTPAVKTLNCQ